MKRKKLPMNLQFFAEPGDGAGDNGTNGGQEPPANTQNQTPQFDYEKLAGIIAGKQSVAEESYAVIKLDKEGSDWKISYMNPQANA